MHDIIDRAHRGEASAAELRQLSEWRRASTDNERTYRQLARLLDAAEALAPTQHTTTPTAAELLGRRRATVAAKRFRAVPWFVGAAAAAAAAAVAGVLAGSTLRPATHAPVLSLGHVVTGATETTTIQLGDGSAVRLAPGSRLLVTNSDTAREVSLEGRAFFAVAKMPGRPFLVHTRGGVARVLGTRFELTTADRDLRLVVVEGRVALSAGDRSVEVRGGEQSGIRDLRTLDPTPVANAARMEQWVGKFLVFQSTPISDAVREIERLYGVRVALGDSAIARRTVTATFTDQKVGQVLDVICSVVNARCESRSDGSVVMSR